MRKRRDNRGRPLNKGENQRKDGRCVYKYKDEMGRDKFVYSWRLVDSDKVPEGRKDDVALRDKIRQIERDIEDGISFADGEMSFADLMKNYFGRKRGVSYNTLRGYKYAMGVVEKSHLRNKRIKDIKPLYLEDWFLMLYDNGKSYATIKSIHAYVKAAFKLAVDNDFIRKNPCGFALSEILKDDRQEKSALTTEQESAFLEFIRTHPKFSDYYDAIVVLFDTGLRISELAGLTKVDVDFANKEIRIDHQLQKENDGKLYISEPKTKESIRMVPMSDRVYEALKHTLDSRKVKVERIVDGKGNFVFLSKTGEPTYAKVWEDRFRKICKEYNSCHAEQLPRITPHICRHTCCTKLQRMGMSDSAVQRMLGHSDIRTTKQHYTHFTTEDVKREFKVVMGV